MSPELDKKLCEDFPELYRDRYADTRTTCMCWGFSCGDGWEPIIRKLSEQLVFLAKAEGVDVRASQVKEKYGTLRFYTWGGTDIMQACISAAERKSEQTCETCGEDGRARSNGWVATLCAKHAYARNYALSDWEANEIGVTDHVREKSDDHLDT